MERSGLLLERANLAFTAVNGANTNDTLQATDTKTSPLFAAHNDFIYLNPKLFRASRRCTTTRPSLDLNPEQAKLLDVYYKAFVHAGAELSPAKQAQLKAMNKRLSTLQTAILPEAARRGQGRRAARRPTPAALAGLSAEQIAAAQQAAKDRKLAGYVLPLQNTTQQPALESLTSHDTRQKLFDASLNRAEHGDANDTRATIARDRPAARQKGGAVRLSELGRLHALRPDGEEPRDRRSASSTASPRRRRPRSGRRPPTSARWRSRRAPASRRRRRTGTSIPSRSAKQRYALDSDQLKPYFEFNKVLNDGVFYAANQLYGVTFTERNDMPTWNPDMRVFEVHDQDG